MKKKKTSNNGAWVIILLFAVALVAVILLVFIKSRLAADNISGNAALTTGGRIVGNYRSPYHDSDYVNNKSDFKIELKELLRITQFFNTGSYHIDRTTEDGFAPGPGSHDGPFHSADTSQNWKIELKELLRVVQFFNTGGYIIDNTTEDGFAPRPPTTPNYVPIAIESVGNDYIEIRFNDTNNSRMGQFPNVVAGSANSWDTQIVLQKSEGNGAVFLLRKVNPILPICNEDQSPKPSIVNTNIVVSQNGFSKTYGVSFNCTFGGYYAYNIDSIKVRRGTDLVAQWFHS